MKKNISTKTELYAHASRRKKDGECDLAMFVYSKSDKVLAELICKAWQMHRAEAELSEDSKSRMDRMQEALDGDCQVQGCTWLQLALEVLNLNAICPKQFGDTIFKAIKFGRNKFNNIMIIGRSNTAKTFLLKPLKSIFEGRLFENPTKDKFGWNGIDKCQVVMLQDFRYTKEVISWSDFLLMLEGETVKLPAPKNHRADDIHLVSDNSLPIFATGPGKIEYSRFSPDFEVETDMMDSRWVYIKLEHVFKKKDQKEVSPCGHCFAKLVGGIIE